MLPGVGAHCPPPTAQAISSGLLPGKGTPAAADLLPLGVYPCAWLGTWIDGKWVLSSFLAPTGWKEAPQGPAIVQEGVSWCYCACLCLAWWSAVSRGAPSHGSQWGGGGAFRSIPVPNIALLKKWGVEVWDPGVPLRKKKLGPPQGHRGMAFPQKNGA